MDKTISLKVRKSDVERVGMVRVNDEVLTKLGVQEGKQVVISKDEQMILRKKHEAEERERQEIQRQIEEEEARKRVLEKVKI